MNPNPVKQYTTRLELPNHFIGDLSAPDPSILKESLQRILNGGTRFDPVAGSTDVLAVYHPSFDSGKTPLTMISPVVVAEHMSNKAIVERRLQAA